MAQSQQKATENLFQQEQIEKLSKQSLICLLLQILNKQNTTSFEQCQQILDQFNKVQECQIINDQEQLKYNDLYTQSTIVAILNTIIPVYLISTSLFNELSCEQCKILAQDFNINKDASMQYICTNILTLQNNSRRSGIKKDSQFITNTVQILAKLHKYQLANKITVKNILASGILTYEQNQQIQKDDQQEIQNILSLMQQIYQLSIFRVELIKSQFKSEKGIWRPINNNEQYAKYLSEHQQLQQFTSYNQFVNQIREEFNFMISTLKSATENQKTFIGQFNNELVLDYENLVHINTFQLSKYAVSHLSTHSVLQRIPQPALGTRDIMPAQKFMRDYYINQITGIFKQHGAVSIETPVFESTATLTSKYGDDEALIYNLQDFGEQPLSLRYDLTVPFARYCVSNGVESIKRYQLGRVYRRDKPDIKNGRFREFYQLDFDIGTSQRNDSRNEPQIDAEVLAVVSEVIQSFNVDFSILVNSRPLLNKILVDYCQIPQNSFRSICSSIDQLDKIGIDGVNQKLVTQKGLSQEIADQICKIIGIVLSYDQLCNQSIEQIQQTINNDKLFEIIKDEVIYLQRIFTLAQMINPKIVKNLKLDFSLARGLDYYTGMVFEAKLTTNMSSISAGGRYDHLLQTICPTSKMNTCGGSIGIERLFAIMESQLLTSKQERDLDCYICSLPGCKLEEKLKIYGQLIGAGLKVGMNFKDSGSLKSVTTDIQEALKTNCCIAIMVGGNEIEKQIFGIKDLKTQVQEEIKQEELVQYCKIKVGQYKNTCKTDYIKDLYQKMISGKIDKSIFEEQLNKL